MFLNHINHYTPQIGKTMFPTLRDTVIKFSSLAGQSYSCGYFLAKKIKQACTIYVEAQDDDLKMVACSYLATIMKENNITVCGNIYDFAIELMVAADNNNISKTGTKSKTSSKLSIYEPADYNDVIISMTSYIVAELNVKFDKKTDKTFFYLINADEAKRIRNVPEIISIDCMTFLQPSFMDLLTRDEKIPGIKAVFVALESEEQKSSIPVAILNRMAVYAIDDILTS